MLDHERKHLVASIVRPYFVGEKEVSEAGLATLLRVVEETAERAKGRFLRRCGIDLRLRRQRENERKEEEL